MELIGTAAYWEICGGCRGHGRIVLSSGEPGREVYSREGAYNELSRLQDEGGVTEHEVTFLKSQIPSDWPRLSEHADMATVIQCEFCNELVDELRILEEDEEPKTNDCDYVM